MGAKEQKLFLITNPNSRRGGSTEQNRTEAADHCFSDWTYIPHYTTPHHNLLYTRLDLTKFRARTLKLLRPKGNGITYIETKAEPGQAEAR